MGGAQGILGAGPHSFLAQVTVLTRALSAKHFFMVAKVWRSSSKAARRGQGSNQGGREEREAEVRGR